MIVTYQARPEVATHTLVLEGAASELELDALRQHILEILTPKPGKRVNLCLDCQKFVGASEAQGGPDA